MATIVASTDSASDVDPTPDADSEAKPAAPPPKSAFNTKLDALRSGELASDPPAGDDAPPAGDPPTKKDAKPKGDEKPKGDTPATATAPAGLSFKVPGQRPEDPDIDVPIDAERLKAAGLTEKDIVARLGQIRNGYIRRRELETAQMAVEAERGELRDIHSQLVNSPAEFLDVVKPDQVYSLAEAILARLSDEEISELAVRVNQLDGDPSERRVARADAKEASVTRQTEQQRRAGAERERRAYIGQVNEQIASLVPEDMADEDADRFYRFTASELQNWARQQPDATRLDPKDVPTLLKKLGVLAVFGIDIPAAAPEDSARTPSPRAKEPPAKKPAAPAPETAAELKDRHDRRKNAMSAPAGAGAAAAAGGAPRGQSFKDRLAWFKGQK